VADEVNLQFMMEGQPPQVMNDWRDNPPKALTDRNLEQVDESVESFTYEDRYYDWPQKLLFVTTLGFALLFKGFMGSVFRLTVRFDPEGTARTKVTMVGTAHPRTREALGKLAADHGGPVGLTVGV
jgi:hypothetical protein